MGKKILIILGSFSFCIVGFSQTNEPVYPEVGKPCPDFVLQNIQYFPKKTATLKDFRGKWLLLDFWNRVCGACINSFPHINEMQKELGERLQVMMVGIEDRQKEVELIYSKFRAKEKLLMPCAFDSALANRFDYLITPRSILIDDKGIVQCITTTIHTEEMKAFLAGGHPSLPKAYRMNEDPPAEENHILPFDYKRPFAINNNGAVDTDFLFRSILLPFRPGINEFAECGSINNTFRAGPAAFWVLGTPIENLYFYAYLSTFRIDENNYGKYYDKLALEIPDSSLFKYDAKTGKNLFCYSVNLPPSQATVGRVMEIMQRDLQNYFGFEISIETRKCPCWNLVATAATWNRLKTKGGPESFQGNFRVSYTVRNTPFKNIFNMLKDLDGIFFDESGITGNVDMTMDCKDCVLTDVYDVKKALQANGLDLVQSEKEMKVIVVRNPKHDQSKNYSSNTSKN